MKFECPKCGKKYSLPDDKVPAGKDFKVKCKKCGEVIILRGGVPETAQAGADPQTGSSFGHQHAASKPLEEEPTRVFDYSKVDGGIPGYPDPGQQPAMGYAPQAAAPQAAEPAAGYQEEPEWHLAIDGEQMGPYSRNQIVEMLGAGQIDAETFLWKDGFDDWLPAKDIPDFQGAGQQAGPMTDVAGAQPAVPAAAYPGVYEQQRQPAQAKASPYTSGFGQQQAAAPKAEARARTHDLFSPRAAEEAETPPFEGGGQDVVTSSPVIPQQPRVDATHLKGARHDDSVLFSLGSLQALASSSKEPARAVTTTSSEGGSGLIDIRTLAGNVAMSGHAESRADDIFSMGGGGFGQPMGIPTLLQPQEKKSNVLLFVLGGVGGFAVVAVVVLLLGVFVFGWGRPKVTDEGTAKPTLNEEELKAKLLAELQKAGMSGQGPKQGEGQMVASNQGEQKGTNPATPGEEETLPDGTKKKKKKKGGGGESGSGGGDDVLSLPSEPGTKTGSKGGDDLLSLIDAATTKKDKKTGTGTKEEPTKTTGGGTASATLPQTPSKNDVLSAMKSVTGKVKACAKGQTGKAVTSIVFSGSTGKATSATVISGEFKGTPAASCIASAAKSASVPKFKQSSFSVTYPFVVK